MKKNLWTAVIIIISFLSCNSNKKKEVVKKKNEEKMAIINKKGYELMQQKCFICHMEKPDPSKKNTMLAPPMLKVQEHYKPTYSTKEEFVNAITKWVLHPEEKNTLMPGAIRKFNVMPKLPYKEENIKLIAETLYDIDFGNMPKMYAKKEANLQLNNGKKWKINAETKKIIQKNTIELTNFKSANLEAYQQLGKDTFSSAKAILLDKSYDKETFNQLHNFFNDIEKNIHLLIGAKDISFAKEQQKILLKKFQNFSNFFE